MSSAVPVSEVEVSAPVTEAVSDRKRASGGILRVVWERWKKIAQAIGVVQTRILMIVFFFVFAFPIGLLMRMSGDKLRLREPETTNWVAHEHQEQNIEAARRQY